MFSFSVCDYLGNFSDDLTALILDNIKQICENPSKFVEDIIELLKSKIVAFLKDSKYVPHQLRELMEKLLQTLQAKSNLLALPLEGVITTPPGSTACEAIKSSQSTTENPAVQELVAKIKSTIDEKIKEICSSTQQTASTEQPAPVPTGGRRRRRRTSKKSRKSKQTRRRKTTRRY